MLISRKQGSARRTRKAFYSSPNYSTVYSVNCTHLSAKLISCSDRLCEKHKSNSKKDDSCDRTLGHLYTLQYMNYDPATNPLSDKRHNWRQTS